MRIMAKKLYKKICENCGTAFEHRTNQKKYCPDCTEIKHRESNRKAMRKKRGKLKPLDIPLHRLIYLLERYNTEHKTTYSYGQFISLISQNIIKFEE